MSPSNWSIDRCFSHVFQGRDYDTETAEGAVVYSTCVHCGARRLERYIPPDGGS